MPLSSEERAALQARAAGLREEVSAVRAETNIALQEKAQEINDDKLVREVEQLESEATEARAMRDNIAAGNGSVEDAMKVMNEVAGQGEAEPQVEAVVLEEVPPVESAPVAEQPEEAPKRLSDPFADGSIN